MMTRNMVILGSGAEAVTLALALMRPGFVTTLIETDPDAAERALFFLGRLQGMPLPDVAADFGPIARADVVFEASEGGVSQRKHSLAQLKTHLPEKALLATTNPSGGAVGFHLFAPAHIRRLVEISPDLETDALGAMFDLARDMGRVPVLVPMGRASVGTRLQRALYEAADKLLLQGAIPHELDEAMVAFGFDMGVFEAQDLTGLDVAYSDRKRMDRPSLVSDRMVEEGRLGKKVGVGWYRYPGGGGAVIDPLIEDLIREEARFAGIEPRVFDVNEMQQRLVQTLRQEGATLLADGTATEAADITHVLVHGLGFPTGECSVV